MFSEPVPLRKEHNNKILRRILELKGNDNEASRKLHDENLPNAYGSSNEFRAIKSIRLKSAGHICRIARCIG